MLSGALRALFLWLSNRRWMARVALATPLLRRMPLRFVAGTTLDSAVAAVRALNADGASATLDVLGESVSDRASAERAAAAYVATIERIAAEGLDANVSIKLIGRDGQRRPARPDRDGADPAARLRPCRARGQDGG